MENHFLLSRKQGPLLHWALRVLLASAYCDAIYPGTLKVMLHETIRNDDF